MNKINIDCERFIRGAEEIDRKRKIITRIITTVEALLNQKIVISNHQWNYHETVLKIPIGEFSFVIVHSKKTLGCEILDNQGKNHLWWGSTNYAESIPVWVVPTVYANLSAIVEKIDETLLEARIRPHFNFFSKQAD